MQVRVELHGVLQRLAGARELMLDLPESSRAADVFTLLQARSEGLAQHLAACACAVGDRIIAREQALADGTTLVLIPPVSGG